MRLRRYRHGCRTAVFAVAFLWLDVAVCCSTVARQCAEWLGNAPTVTFENEHSFLDGIKGTTVHCAKHWEEVLAILSLLYR